ncbi:MAG: putative 4-hydroxybenzoate polyprenyltransferase [Gemmataceae bacterium]|nr:putative 4-hydroxybenzoate polyprenyltransferase [Gemmataceae bacterium]
MILTRLRLLLELIRFSHTLFALPFALLSALLAWQKKGTFSSGREEVDVAAVDAGSATSFWIEFVGILLCMVFARSAAMAFNRLVDRRFDAANPRTAQRHLPAGLLSAGTVWLFTGCCAAAFLLTTLVFLWATPPNPWPSLLSVPVLLFLGSYSFTKRFTVLAHFWLGASLLLAPLAAWIAILGLTDLVIPLTLGLVVLFWVAGFDIIYACQDAAFDRQAGLRSLPARLGVGPALRVAMACHFVMVVLLAALYVVADPLLGNVYLAAVAVVAVLLVYEHAVVKPSDLTRVNHAFFQVNAVISVGLFVVGLIEVLRGR